MKARIQMNSAKVLAFTLIIIASSQVVLFLQDGPEEDHRVVSTLQSWPSATINITVTDDVGRLIDGASVKIEETGVTSLTGPDGTVEFTNLEADDNASIYEYNLTLTKTNYRGSSARVNVSENWTTYTTMTLYGGSILGTVTTLMPSSGPVVGANVSIASLGIWTVVSPTLGDYQLAGLPGGVHTVSASALGYLTQSFNVNLGIGESKLQNFVLESETGSITGFVRSNNTLAPISDASVSVKIDEQKTVTVTTGSDGSYNITDMPEGTYQLTASKDGFISSTNNSVSVVRGALSEGVDFYLVEKPTRLFGVVRSGTLLLAGVNVSVAGTELYNISGPYGNYEIANLTAGNYTVIAAPTGYQTAVISGVIIEPGGETALNINLTGLPGAIVRGRVLAVDTEAPLSNVYVSVREQSAAQGEPARTITTNIYGEFEFTGLTAGNYTLVFEKEGYSPFESGKIVASGTTVSNSTYYMTPLRGGLGGFFGDFDMAHSMMFIGVLLTLVIFGIALVLRIKSLMTPESSPAVYDQVEEELSEGEEEGPGEPSEEKRRKKKSDESG